MTPINYVCSDLYYNSSRNLGLMVASPASSEIVPMEAGAEVSMKLWDLPVEIIYNNFLPCLDVDICDLVHLQQTCQYFNGLVKAYVAEKVLQRQEMGSPELLSIIGKYGFQQLRDPRNATVIQQAFRVCRFEGLGEGLTLDTLSSRMKVAEDRNLVKIYLDFLEDQDPVEISPWPSAQDVLQTQTKKEKTKKVSEVADAIKKRIQNLFGKQPESAKAKSLERMTHASQGAQIIRAHIEINGNIQVSKCLNFTPPIEALEKIDRVDNEWYVSVIPPQIRYFNTEGVNASHNIYLMLISRNIGEIFRDQQAPSEKILDIRHNQLKVIPDEAAELYTYYYSVESRRYEKVLASEQNLSWQTAHEAEEPFF